MHTVSLALLWHQHQPYYPDDVSGENPMPWVRLHGTKDYYGMALHVKEVPEFRCTINLVPSLLLQIQKYTDGSGSDRHLDVSRIPADALSEDDAHYMLDHFFMASLEHMIRPHARFYELYRKRGFGIDRVERALPRFSERDLRDLQVWSNLTWMHPLLFEQDAELRAFRDKGHSWTESEKAWLLERQLDVLRDIIPLHRQLAEGGQVELTTTPFFHPILPLLWDKRSARQAMPGCPLPKDLTPYREDAQLQLQRAVDYHEQLFGVRPRGLWPSEGSVSQDIIAPIRDAGIEWIATDEEILTHSTSGWISRDEHGHMRHPEMLYRPWRVSDGAKQLQIIFRDHALSDLIGFHYQRSDPVHAAQDMLGRVDAIRRAVEGPNGGRPGLVPVILDGENCWEYYHDGGVQFLRTLYREAARHPHIRPMRVGDHLTEYPATDRITNLFAGSWISHNFAIWIGHEEDRTAWDLLHDTREFLRQAEADARHPSEKIQQAWEEIYITEGSDWFWWFGDDHSSAQDALFDQLFRKHLENVYLLLETPVPPAIRRPITRAQNKAIHTQPKSFLPVKIDGEANFFEWRGAGRYVSGSERGTMTLVTEGLVREVRFGFDAHSLMLRLDTARHAADDLAPVDEVRVSFLEPPDTEIRITGWKHAKLETALTRAGEPRPSTGIRAAVSHVVELAVPFELLDRRPGDRLHWFIEAIVGKASVDRVPREGLLECQCPSPDFEMIMWQV